MSLIEDWCDLKKWGAGGGGGSEVVSFPDSLAFEIEAENLSRSVVGRDGY